MIFTHKLISDKDKKMSHNRGQIEKKTDMFKEIYFRIYTGCQHLDDFYTCNTFAQAKQISEELLQSEAT